MGSGIVSGSSARRIDVLLKGPAAVLPPERERFSNVMPAFGGVYNDAEVASLVNYLRANFAPAAPAVTAAEVAAQRAHP